MKIGIIIYSLSGHTREVAEKLKSKLAEGGHLVAIDEITISGKTPAQPGNFKLLTVPSPLDYDAVILGSPVQAFSLHPVLKAYLEKLPPLNGKKTAIFVTKQLPLLWTGGTGSIATIKKALEQRGGKVLGPSIVVWSEAKREAAKKKCIDHLSRIF